MNGGDVRTTTGGQAFAALQSAIVTALKRQDRDTRHACAEAVASLAHTPGLGKGAGIAGQMLESWDTGYETAIAAAHDTIVNVKAV